MPIDIRSTIYALDRGIDRIVDGEPDASSLPERSALLPWEFGHVPELQRLLSSLPSLDATLLAAVMPEISDQKLLSPRKFRDALRSALNTLRSTATGDSELDKLLRRAARELDALVPLYGLLFDYENALLQG